MRSFKLALAHANRALKQADPTLAQHIDRVGPCLLEAPKPFEPFEALTSSITHQQLHGKAAQTILQRVHDKFGAGKAPTAKTIHRARLPSLRTCGLSQAKALALKDLAAKTLDGTVPSSDELHRLDDDAIIERLTQVRGIGPWTVQMMLMFRMGRLDVLPTADFGVRMGFTKLYGHATQVTPKALTAYAEAWKPYRSVASWYMWRVHDV